MDVGASEGAAASLSCRQFFSQQVMADLYKVTPLARSVCHFLPRSLARFISSPLPQKPQFELVPAVLPLAGFFLFASAKN